MTLASVIPPIRDLKTKDSKDQQRLMVAVRIRPMSHREEATVTVKSINAVIAKAVDEKTVIVYHPAGTDIIGLMIK